MSNDDVRETVNKPFSHHIKGADKSVGVNFKSVLTRPYVRPNSKLKRDCPVADYLRVVSKVVHSAWQAKLHGQKG